MMLALAAIQAIVLAALILTMWPKENQMSDSLDTAVNRLTNAVNAVEADWLKVPDLSAPIAALDEASAKLEALVTPEVVPVDHSVANIAAERAAGRIAGA